MTTLPFQDLSEEAFAPYGRVLQKPARDPDATGSAWSWWADDVLFPSDGRSVGIGYLDLEPGEPSFDWAEHHLRTVEVIVPLGAECLAYVGPFEPAAPIDQLPRRETFEVFR